MEEFDCDNCGACCRTFSIFASATDAGREPRIRREAQQLAPGQATPVWEYRLFPLPFLETCCFLGAEYRCEIYATRPDVCRQFAAGGPQCQESRARQGLPLLKPVSQIERG